MADDAGITGLLGLLPPEPLLHLDTQINVVTAIVILADVTGIVVAKQIASLVALREPLRSGMALNPLRKELREADRSSAAGNWMVTSLE